MHDFCHGVALEVSHLCRSGARSVTSFCEKLFSLLDVLEMCQPAVKGSDDCVPENIAENSPLSPSLPQQRATWFRGWRVHYLAVIKLFSFSLSYKQFSVLA